MSESLALVGAIGTMIGSGASALANMFANNDNKELGKILEGITLGATGRGFALGATGNYISNNMHNRR